MCEVGQGTGRTDWQLRLGVSKALLAPCKWRQASLAQSEGHVAPRWNYICMPFYLHSTVTILSSGGSRHKMHQSMYCSRPDGIAGFSLPYMQKYVAKDLATEPTRINETVNMLPSCLIKSMLHANLKGEIICNILIQLIVGCLMPSVRLYPAHSTEPLPKLLERIRALLL